MNRARALKAAGLYLEMRGFNILEQAWSLGPTKIDIIATKADKLFFIAVELTDTKDINKPLPSEDRLNKLVKAGSSWLDINKYSGEFSFCLITLDEKYRVISFSEDLIY